MRGLLIVCAALTAGAWIAPYRAEQQPASSPPASSDPVVVTRADGGAMSIPLGMGINVNKDSKSLRREWISISDARMPAALVQTPGVTVVYEAEKYSGHFEYAANFDVEAKEPLAAIEVRFVCFDVWGGHVKTLSVAEVTDIPKADSGSSAPFRYTKGARWRIFSDNDAVYHYASIAYVARVRTQSGRIVVCDPTAPLAEAKKLSSKFTEAALDPAPPAAPK